MPPRLLSLLSSIESSLASHGSAAVSAPPLRSVNFQKGIARMTFVDGSGSITLQNFTLADGQICVKAEFCWSHSDSMGSYAVYPTPQDFDWFGAAVKIAQAWMNGATATSAAAANQMRAINDSLIAAS